MAPHTYQPTSQPQPKHPFMLLCTVVVETDAVTAMIYIFSWGGGTSSPETSQSQSREVTTSKNKIFLREDTRWHRYVSLSWWSVKSYFLMLPVYSFLGTQNKTTPLCLERGGGRGGGKRGGGRANGRSTQSREEYVFRFWEMHGGGSRHNRPLGMNGCLGCLHLEE